MEDIWGLRPNITSADFNNFEKSVFGPVMNMTDCTAALDWKWEEPMVFKRSNGIAIHWTKGEDGLFGHMVREDLRNALIHQSHVIKLRDHFKGSEIGLDYETTTSLMRAKHGRVRTAAKNEIADEARQFEDEDWARSDRHKLDQHERSLLRLITTGAAPCGHYMWRAKFARYPACAYCGECPDDEPRHIWKCSATKECRKDILKEYSEEYIDNLPNVVAICGWALDDGRLNEHFQKLALEEEEEARPPQIDSEDEMSVNSDGFIKVAGDGACPQGQNDYRMRRAGCGLSHGKKNSHNTSWALGGRSQNAQRAELRTMVRWAAWSWAKQVCFTD